MIYSIVKLLLETILQIKILKAVIFTARVWLIYFQWLVDLSEYFVIYKPTNQLLVFCRAGRHILDVISMKYMESSRHLSIRLIFITQTELQRP